MILKENIFNIIYKTIFKNETNILQIQILK